MNDAELTNQGKQKMAADVLRKEVGVWDARWEFLDEAGNMTGTAVGLQTMGFAIDECVLQVVMDVPEIGLKSVSHRFYKPDESVICWISVDNHGDTWTFLEDVETRSADSLPHKNPDGSVTSLRYHLLRETTNEVDLVMESSGDDGSSWVPIFRQFRVRR